MAQPVRKIVVKPRKNKKTPQTTKKKHQEYGVSKLEDKFAKEFLDKLGVRYIRQFKAASIGRYFDFYLPDDHLLIEIDGDYYHSYGKLYEEMSPMQKHNKRVDQQKDHWALINGIPLMRIWEHDIHKNKNTVLERLKKRITVSKEEKEKKDKKKRRNWNENNTIRTSIGHGDKKL